MATGVVLLHRLECDVERNAIEPDAGPGPERTIHPSSARHSILNRTLEITGGSAEQQSVRFLPVASPAFLFEQSRQKISIHDDQAFPHEHGFRPGERRVVRRRREAQHPLPAQRRPQLSVRQRLRRHERENADARQAGGRGDEVPPLLHRLSAVRPVAGGLS